MLSDNPPERDMEWTETGIAGAHRFAQRLYRLTQAVTDQEHDTAVPASCTALTRAVHRTIGSVTVALDQFAFNVAVARLYELLNAIVDCHRGLAPADAAGAAEVRSALDVFARLAAPMMPHLACDILARLHPQAAALPDLTWPVADPAMLAETTMTIAVQVGGKLRGTVDVPADAPEAVVVQAAMDESNVARLLAGKTIVKQIYVPRRIVSFAVKEEV